MTDVSLLTLPIEIIHSILHYCDTETILLSIRPVCKRLYSIVNDYNQFQLTLDYKSVYNFPFICRLIPTESIVTLNILKQEYGFSYVDFLQSTFDIRRFTRLRSLKIRYTNEEDLVQFFKLVSTDRLISLSIDSCERDISRLLRHVKSAIDKFQIQKLFLNKFDHVVKHMSWPVNGTLTYLEIGICNYNEYITLLQYLPNLRTILMTKCVMNENDAKIVSTSVVKFSSLLQSLTITDFPMTSQQFQSMISFTPYLVHLKLTCENYRKFDRIFDGSYWEDLIRNNLSSLNKFEMYFWTRANETSNLAELIVPFQTPFWIKEKRWHIACAFLIQTSHNVLLYTVPIRVKNDSILVRSQISSLDGVFRLTKRPLNELFDSTADDTFNTLYYFTKDIREEEMRYLCDGLQNNTTITTLFISIDDMVNKRIKDLANVLKNNMTVTALHLTQNHIDEEGAQYLQDALENNNTLTTLELGWNKIGPQEAYHLTHGLANNTTLTTLNLHCNSLKDEGMPHIGEALAKNTTLTMLNLQYNQIGVVGAQYLANSLRNNNKLATLELKWNPTHEQGAQYLADALQHNTALTTLGLETNWIKNDGTQYLANALRHNTTLTTLCLEENGIEDVGAQHLADALRNNSTLKKLYLYQNRIKKDGVKLLADALRMNTTLTTFAIGWNCIGIEVAQHFADVIRHNKTLTELDIQSNNIKDEGAILISNALRSNTTLALLDLSDNKIQQEGFKHIADALQVNTALTTIDLCCNGMKVPDAQYIANAIRDNKTLTEVRLFDEKSWREKSWDLDKLHKQDKRLVYERNNGYRRLVSRGSCETILFQSS